MSRVSAPPFRVGTPVDITAETDVATWYSNEDAAPIEVRADIRRDSSNYPIEAAIELRPDADASGSFADRLKIVAYADATADEGGVVSAIVPDGWDWKLVALSAQVNSVTKRELK